MSVYTDITPTLTFCEKKGEKNFSSEGKYLSPAIWMWSKILKRNTFKNSFGINCTCSVLSRLSAKAGFYFDCTFQLFHQFFFTSNSAFKWIEICSFDKSIFYSFNRSSQKPLLFALL